jgi:predicted GIY-YIG superfamily endonuclease
MKTIFILSLENNKIFIDKSSDPHKKISKHFLGKGAEWTIRYKPETIITIFDENDKIDKIVRNYMYKYGIDNVRGGSYQDFILDKDKVKKEIFTENNSCLRCGYKNHNENDCYASKDIFDEILEDKQCYRCGRYGHIFYDCYAKKNIDGDYIDSDGYYTSDSEK